MLLTMNGLVLRETQAGDKGRFIDILTEELGVIEVFVRGSKKITGRSVGATQLFSYAAFNIEQQKDKYYFKSAEPIRIFYQLREDLRNLSLASYFSELVRYVVPKSRNDKEILRLLLNTLHFLSLKKRPPEMLKPLFELRLASETGFMPDVLMCRRCMNYLPDDVVFSIRDGIFLCGSCYSATHTEAEENPYDIFRMNLSGLEMIRHITLTDNDRLFNFRAGKQTLDAVGAYAEAFVRSHFGFRPASLEFYRRISDTEYNL